MGVTFNVDMSCAPAFDNVFVTGPWCGWCHNDVYNTMTDDDGDGIYSVTVPDLVGSVEYKRHQRIRGSGEPHQRHGGRSFLRTCHGLCGLRKSPE